MLETLLKIQKAMADEPERPYFRHNFLHCVWTECDRDDARYDAALKFIAASNPGGMVGGEYLAGAIKRASE